MERGSISSRRATERRRSATARGSSRWPYLARPLRRASPCGAAAGFTLIELVIVLIVLAAAGSLAIPAIQPALESVRAEAAVRRTASFLDDARRRAVLERRVLVVRCQIREGRLELVGASGGDATFPIPEQVELVSCRPGEVRYNPQGSAARSMALILRDRGGRERHLTVGAFTGLARVDTPW